MQTQFNIGDKIKLEMVGEIIEYSARKNDDCYTIELPDATGKPSRDLRVYLSSDQLKAARAKRVQLNEDHFLRLIKDLRVCSNPRQCCYCARSFQKDGCDKLESDAADAIEYLLAFIKGTLEESGHVDKLH